MQKKIIALAVAGLVSGAAFAQSNVTIYGIMDMSYTYQGSNVLPGGDSYSGFDSGGWDGSRFRFKGTEELGNGLSVGFDTEFDFGTDQGTGLTVAKNHLFLAGKTWGTVKAGSFGNSLDDVAGYSESGGLSWGNQVVSLLVVDSNYNAVKYVSPNWSGFSFNAAYSTNNQNTQDSTTNDVTNLVDDNRPAWDVGASYVNGGLKLGFGYESTDSDTGNLDADEWVLTGGYNFGMFQLGAAYANFDGSTDARDVDRDAWRVTAGWDITPADHVALSYSASSSDWKVNGANSDYDADAWGISYAHALSKRTHIYAAAYVADADRGFLGVDDYNSAEVAGYENGFKVGVRHLF